MNDGIDWAEVGAGGRFEKIVSVLLSTLYPSSERIDGSGGDGGRDHQLRTEERLDLWQSKYFLKRLSESTTRKGQITASLITAAGLQPDSWTLVTPMVPTPEERAWFDQLQPDYPFPLEWKGGDWLDARLAEHPAIVRHFMSANDEYVALLRELKQEEEALVDGLPGATQRIERLAAKIDDANPFYKVDFVIQDGRIVSSSLRPKYRGAEQDSPVTISFNVSIGSSTEDADVLKGMRAALDWGDEVELPASHVRDLVVDAPHGFGGTHEHATIKLGPAEQEPVDLNLRLVVREPDGRQLAALPARLVTRTNAARGVTLHGKDITGVVNARLRLDLADSTVSLSLTYGPPPPLLPGAYLAILRFMHHAVAPNTLSFGVGGVPSTAPVALPEREAVPAALIELVEGLDRLQAAAGEAFPVPEQWTVNDQQQVRRAVRLLDGQRVEVGRGPVHFSMDDPHALITAFSNSPIASLAITAREPYVAHVAGHDLDLGAYTIYVQQARLEQPAEPDINGTCQLSVLPEPGFGVEIALGELTQAPGQGPAEPHDDRQIGGCVEPSR